MRAYTYFIRSLTTFPFPALADYLSTESLQESLHVPSLTCKLSNILRTNLRLLPVVIMLNPFRKNPRKQHDFRLLRKLKSGLLRVDATRATMSLLQPTSFTTRKPQKPHYEIAVSSYFRFTFTAHGLVWSSMECMACSPGIYESLEDLQNAVFSFQPQFSKWRVRILTRLRLNLRRCQK